MEEDDKISILLRRPILATGGAVFDVQQGKMNLRVGDDSITFNVYKTMKNPQPLIEVWQVDAIEEEV